MQTHIEHHPVIAILRGIPTTVVVEIASAIYAQGIRVIEVPLSKPDAFECIRQLVEYLPSDCLIGAGTVTTIEQIEKLAALGAQLVISPHYDSELIVRCHELNLTVVPGISTPTEAFSAYHAGARWLKLFPAVTYGLSHLRALKVVLPSDAKIIAVGGINPTNSQQWLEAGSAAIGIGNALYSVNDDRDSVERKLKALNQQINLAVLNLS